ncbi:LysR family transcriptional regulator [Amycolatopsis saalfeldensis]|uniref:DNA-binding transcriptional regulator, LysR family n=1 Tax=Amycolatopsis saalfeldensis TaxID=394193 RepID=A0A1H8QBL9_9PSEU|nr:LysR substrate-binding domain-containing protein [Amycolatopsis saalfeldensis]SEO51317.1 DNA-binding transcriptional regulator, LysR family [Amycolatopsis saalfeldensis]
MAEHGNFHRAADALRIAQPSLSRQVQRLEQRLGVRLLDRTAQGSRLTEAGHAFLPEATALLRSAELAATKARAAAIPNAVTIGYVGGLLVTAPVRELRARHPDAEVRTRHLDWTEVRPALLEHRVDAVLSREPFPAGGLSVTVLYEEPRVLLVPADHRLAGKESITLDDLAGEPLVRYADAAYDAFWRIDPRPDGSPAPDGPLVETTQDKLEAVAGGRALALAPAAGGNVARGDLTAVTVEGIPPCRVTVAVRAGERGRLVTAFRSAARSQLTG